MSRKDKNFDSEEKDDLNESEEPVKSAEGNGNGEDRSELSGKGEGQKPEFSVGEKKSRHSSSHIPHYVLFAGVFLVGILIGAIAAPSLTGSVVAGGQDIGVQAAANKLMDYVNLFPSVKMTSFAGEGNSSNIFYQVNINVTTVDGTQTVPLYISRDGKYMLGGVAELDTLINKIRVQQGQQDQNTGEQQQASSDVPKSDKPVAELFIMSYCPYGLQMQKAFLPVMKLLGDKAYITIKWVSYSMHGKKELDENTRQYCIEKEQADKYIDYASCFTASGDSDSCLADAGIDTTKLDACVAATDEEFNITGLYNDKSTWSGGRYPQFNTDKALNVQYGVRGSPTTVINGKTVSVSRSPEAVKQAICNAFSTPPEECQQALSTAQASPGIGGGTAGAGGSADAQCN